MKLDDFKKKLLERPDIRAEYEALAEELGRAKKQTLEQAHEKS